MMNKSRNQTPSRMHRNGRPIPVIVIGTGLTALGVMRCLGRKGIPAFCISKGLGFEAYSRWCRKTAQRVGSFGTASELAAALESAPIDRAVLIPCSDHWVRELTGMDPNLRERFPACLPARECLSRFVSKRLFADLLAEAGVPRPESRVVESESDLDGIDIGEGARWFFKPVDSQRFHARFGEKAIRLDTMNEAVSHLAEIRNAGFEVILQEYIPGPADRHYFVDGFVDRNHRLHACFARRRLRMYPPDFGNSSYMVSIEKGEVSEAIGVVEALFEATRYRGVFSAEFKFDHRDNHFKILEVNCRPWWYVEFAGVCGVDVVEMAYSDALGLPMNPVERYQVGAGLFFAYNDYHAFRYLWRRGELSPGRWLRSLMAARQAVFCWDDPMPALATLGERVAAKFKRPAHRPTVA